MPFYCGDKLLLYHTPKCGGTWARFALASAGLPWKMLDGYHQHATSQEVPESLKAGRVPFCLVRKPETWLQSCWRFKMQKNGHRWTRDHAQAELWYAPTFEEAIERYLTSMPGHLSRYFYRFVSGCRGNVLRQECLADDLVALLRRVGATFSEKALRAFPPKNVGLYDDCQYGPGQLERVRQAEIETYKRFYGGV